MVFTSLIDNPWQMEKYCGHPLWKTDSKSIYTEKYLLWKNRGHHEFSCALTKISIKFHSPHTVLLCVQVGLSSWFEKQSGCSSRHWSTTETLQPYSHTYVLLLLLLLLLKAHALKAVNFVFRNYDCYLNRRCLNLVLIGISSFQA